MQLHHSKWMRPTGNRVLGASSKLTNVVGRWNNIKCLAIKDPDPQSLRSPLVAEEVIFFLFQVSNGTAICHCHSGNEHVIFLGSLITCLLIEFKFVRCPCSLTWTFNCNEVGSHKLMLQNLFTKHIFIMSITPRRS